MEASSVEHEHTGALEARRENGCPALHSDATFVLLCMLTRNLLCSAQSMCARPAAGASTTSAPAVAWTTFFPNAGRPLSRAALQVSACGGCLLLFANRQSSWKVVLFLCGPVSRMGDACLWKSHHLLSSSVCDLFLGSNRRPCTFLNVQTP